MVRESLSTKTFADDDQVAELALSPQHTEAGPTLALIDIDDDSDINQLPSPQSSALTVKGDTAADHLNAAAQLDPPPSKKASKQASKPSVNKQNPKTTQTAKQKTKEESDETTRSIQPKANTFRVKSGDSLAVIFKRAGLKKGTLPKVLALEDSKRYLRKIHPGDVIRITLNTKGSLDTLSFDIDAFHKLIVFSDEDSFASTIETASRETRVTSATGRINSSLFLAAKDAGLSDTLVMGLVDIFEWDIDFAQDLRNGDHFSVVYEEILKDGKKISDGRILAAEFVNQNNEHRAVRFEHSSRSGFYDPDGKALRKAFLRNPVKFSRISSRFTLKRWHPILKKWRAHRGVDYAARMGTPVRATGDGRIKTIGWVKGYGRVVMIEHGKRYLTVYGHLSKFARGLKKGSRIRQGQLIAYVGKSGYATGPHLHYEFRVDGHHRDPLKVKLPGAPSLPKKLLAKFRQAATPHLATLDRLSQTLLAKNEHH